MNQPFHSEKQYNIQARPVKELSSTLGSGRADYRGEAAERAHAGRSQEPGNSVGRLKQAYAISAAGPEAEGG